MVREVEGRNFTTKGYGRAKLLSWWWSGNKGIKVRGKGKTLDLVPKITSPYPTQAQPGASINPMS